MTAPTRDEIWTLVETQHEKFVEILLRSFSGDGSTLGLRELAEYQADGSIRIKNFAALVKILQALFAKASVAGAEAVIELVSGTPPKAKTADELETLKKRVERIEGELLGLLPPEFDGPNSGNAMRN